MERVAFPREVKVVQPRSGPTSLYQPVKTRLPHIPSRSAEIVCGAT